jgi:plastocyanin
MVRHRWLIGQLALVGVLALLAFPGASSALLPTYSVSLTAAGPSPAVLKLPAGYNPEWSNTDTVTHTVVFANGLCSIQVAPGSSGRCTSGFTDYVGDYPYTVDGTGQAQLSVEAIHRSVSLRARVHTIDRGSRLTLHGQLQDIQYGSPPNSGSPQPIMVLARPDRYHAFHRIAVVRAKLHLPKGANPLLGKLLWRLRVHPRAKTIYIAEASYQPQGGQVWQQAWSKPFRLRVRH